MRNNRAAWSMAVGVAIILSTTGTAHAGLITTIDAMNSGKFSASSMSVDFAAPGTSNHKEMQQTALANVLSGYRDTKIDYPGPLDPNADSGDAASTRMSTTVNNLAFQSPPSVQATLAIGYQGAATGTDLTVGGASAFGLTVIAADSLLPLTLSVISADGHAGSETLNIPIVAAPTLLELPFSGFSGTIDFSHVTSMNLAFAPPVAGDFSIGAFGTVSAPEPASLGLLGVGALGLLWHGRRRSHEC